MRRQMNFNLGFNDCLLPLPPAAFPLLHHQFPHRTPLFTLHFCKVNTRREKFTVYGVLLAVESRRVHFFSEQIVDFFQPSGCYTTGVVGSGK